MDQTLLYNQAIIEGLNTNGFEKQSADLVEDWTRTKVRETGFMRQILPFRNMPREKLVRLLYSDKPYYIVDKEPDSPASMTVGYGELPMTWSSGAAGTRSPSPGSRRRSSSRTSTNS